MTTASKTELRISQKNLLTIANSSNSTAAASTPTTPKDTGAKSKSLINVIASQQQQQVSPAQHSQLNEQPIDKIEKTLMKKYARYSKQSPKSVSAVLRQPTLTNYRAPGGGDKSAGSGVVAAAASGRRYQSVINKQTSLSQLVLSKLVSMNSSHGNVSKVSSPTAPASAKYTIGEVTQSQNNSFDMQEQSTTTTKHAATTAAENHSVVSSKISLFKKTVNGLVLIN